LVGGLAGCGGTKPIDLVEHDERLEARAPGRRAHPAEHLLEDHAEHELRSSSSRCATLTMVAGVLPSCRLHPRRDVERGALAPRRERR
jgi:hypothetical protein